MYMSICILTADLPEMAMERKREREREIPCILYTCDLQNPFNV